MSSETHFAVLPRQSAFLRSLFGASVFLACALASSLAQAPAPGGPAAAAPSQQSAMVDLINRLVARGALSPQDAAQLIAQAEADSADARVQAAEVLLASAKADAAAARAQAALAQTQAALAQAEAARAVVAQMAAAQRAAAQILSGALPASAVGSTAAGPSAAQVAPAPAPVVTPVPVTAAPSYAPPSEAPPANTIGNPVAAEPAPMPSAPGPAVPPPAAPIPETTVPAGPVPPAAAVPVTTVPSDSSQPPTTSSAEMPVGAPPQSAAEAPSVAPPPATAPQAQPSPAIESNAPPAPVAEAPQAGAPGAGSSASGDGSAGSDDSVRVSYVPEVVKNQLREEVKDDVLAEARKENWGGTHPYPEWVSRFTLYGDVRVRYEFLFNHKSNDDSGNAFPDFNAINTSSPFDLAGNVAEPQYNVDQDRNRMRMRARMGETIDLQNGFTSGLRIATGNDDQPVSENQTLGAAGTGQGGDFSKYELWLDRAYIKYQSGGDPTRDISVSVGRFDNPFIGTTLIWATDLAFDGIAASVPLKVHHNGRVVDSVKPFLVGGFFPVFNTDLNFATDNAAKYPSNDKWLDAVQAGATWTAGGNFDFKAAAAYYYFQNIQGQLSTPFVPLTSSDAGNTDDSRPSFAQNGNTYMELRDIVPSPLNDNGTIDQFQYFGLATPFHEVAFDTRIDYNQFEPFQVSLTGEFVENVAFNEQAIAAKAVNNLGTAPASGGAAPFVGGNKGWNVILKFGDAVLQQSGDWNFSLGYRYLESDAVVDGFTDADFGGDLLGTNLKGFTLDGSLALAPGIIFETKWMSASAIAGPSYKNDYLQMDINAKF